MTDADHGPHIEAYPIRKFTSTFPGTFYSPILDKKVTKDVTQMTCPKCGEPVDMPKQRVPGGHSCGLYWWLSDDKLIISDKPFATSPNPYLT
jgi:hypothetical protein